MYYGIITHKPITEQEILEMFIKMNTHGKTMSKDHLKRTKNRLLELDKQEISKELDKAIRENSDRETILNLKKRLHDAIQQLREF